MDLDSSVSLTEKSVSNWLISWGMVVARRDFRLLSVRRRRKLWGGVRLGSR